MVGFFQNLHKLGGGNKLKLEEKNWKFGNWPPHKNRDGIVFKQKQARAKLSIQCFSQKPSSSGDLEYQLFRGSYQWLYSVKSLKRRLTNPVVSDGSISTSTHTVYKVAIL